MKKISSYVFFIIAMSSFLCGCHTEVLKDDNMQKNIPPGSAKIEGEIVSIEPVNNRNIGPCGKYPCIAKVRLESIVYGAGFPALSVGKAFRIQFDYTLVKTTEEMFPDMDESYPGLLVGDKFAAMVLHSIQMEGSELPEFEISSYLKK
ncbi:MAG: hypothetical protein WB779_04705 [Ignavibacteriaceae bacterium]